MSKKKEIIGDPIVINGRQLSLSRAVRAGDFVYLTGQVPFKDGQVMTTGSIEEQTHAVLTSIKETLALAGCELSDVVKSMVWLKDRCRFSRLRYCLRRILPRRASGSFRLSQ